MLGFLTKFGFSKYPWRVVAYFARHGESEANVLKIFANEGTGYGLTEKGRAQAVVLAEALRGEKISFAFASPLLRAQETASIICSRLKITFETSLALKEFGVGDREGTGDEFGRDEYRWVEHQWMTGTDPNARIGGGECLRDVRNRLVPFVNGWIESLADVDARVLFIGHGGTFTCALPALLMNVDNQFALDHPIKPAGLIVAKSIGKKLFCLSWTDTVLPLPIPEVAVQGIPAG